jgi:hypothetical protein
MGKDASLNLMTLEYMVYSYNFHEYFLSMLYPDWQTYPKGHMGLFYGSKVAKVGTDRLPLFSAKDNPATCCHGSMFRYKSNFTFVL